ncbi:hypothetical protein MSSAC_2310 [Methanosarcina siciliae C2J]|uniref:Uncharacterized protein n=2 Tax=Methanosarcina siciliae TaxID=38027 RepID=A0A0E3PP10_9EURY|nr:hypothetical protein MSSAC_2310 [Methanosarcina siciliae C2J]
MEAWKVCVLCIIIGLTAVPAVSAKDEYAVNSNMEDTFVSAEKHYIVSPWVENSSAEENPLFSVLSTY